MNIEDFKVKINNYELMISNVKVSHKESVAHRYKITFDTNYEKDLKTTVTLTSIDKYQKSIEAYVIKYLKCSTPQRRCKPTLRFTIRLRDTFYHSNINHYLNNNIKLIPS